MFDISELTTPATNAKAVTKSDSDTFDATKAVYVGATGDVKVTMFGGMDVTFEAVPTGTVLPIRVTKIFSTGTSASKFVILW